MGYGSLYRAGVGEWRISYVAQASRLIGLMLKVAPKGDAWRF